MKIKVVNLSNISRRPLKPASIFIVPTIRKELSMVRRTLRIAIFTFLALGAFTLVRDAQASNTAQQHAQWVLSRYNNGWGISLLEYTLGCGCDDGATPADNIRDAAAGRAANRSNYGTAPGGTVTLKHDLLYGMQKLKERYDHTYRVTAIAGGSA